MPKLYIANCTPHNQTLYYRVDIDPSGNRHDAANFRLPKSQSIRSGRQEPVGGELAMVQIEDIVAQLNPFGLKAPVDLSKGIRQLGFIPYLFNIDKPVPLSIFQDVIEHNKGVKMSDGRERRLRAAVAANDALAQRIGTNAEAFAVEYEQQDVSERDESPIAEGVRVDPSADAKSRSRGGKAGSLA